jgi:hypothetical protein
MNSHNSKKLITKGTELSNSKDVSDPDPEMGAFRILNRDNGEVYDIRDVNLDELTPFRPRRYEEKESEPLSRTTNNNSSQSKRSRLSNASRENFKKLLSGANPNRKLIANDGDNKIVAISESDDNRVIRFLYKNRVYGFPKSYGTISSNYWHFVRNNHPFFSLFLSHKLHPFPKKNRLIVFFCVSVFFKFIYNYFDCPNLKLSVYFLR